MDVNSLGQRPAHILEKVTAGGKIVHLAGIDCEASEKLTLMSA